MSTSDPGSPSDLGKINVTAEEINYLQSNYTTDLAELRKFSGMWTENYPVVEEILRSSSECICKKCDALKPLRTHHCSVCDKCVLLMDHHCMWTNNCIGLKNYKPFLQLNLFGQIACWYTIISIWIATIEDNKAPLVESSGFLYFAKMWDLLVGKMMLALTGFNFYIMSTGLTYLEFRNLMETRARGLNLQAYGKIEKTGNPSQDKHKNIVKFHYGFGTRWENMCRVLKTKNLFVGLVFISWFEDKSLDFNGSEWTCFYFRNQIARGGLSAEEREGLV